MRRYFIATVVAAFIIVPIAIAGEGPMLKFELKEYSQGETPTEVKVSIPFGMLEALRPQIDKALQEVDLHGHDIDFKAIWQEVKNTGPNDFVEVKNEEGTVLVSTTETHIVIKIDQEDEKIDIAIPLVLGDAFLGMEKVDFDQVLDALLDLKGQDLLTISGDKMEARAWIE